jgi:hypothetical protein
MAADPYGELPKEIEDAFITVRARAFNAPHDYYY